VYLASPLPQVKAGAAAPLCVSTTFPTTAFLRFWRRFVKCQRGGRRHADTETRAKNFLFCLCIVDLDTIIGFSGKPNKTLNKLNKTSKAQS